MAVYRSVKDLQDGMLQHRRNDLAEKILLAMIASPPLCDRDEVDTDVWAKKAFEFADSFLKHAGT